MAKKIGEKKNKNEGGATPEPAEVKEVAAAVTDAPVVEKNEKTIAKTRKSRRKNRGRGYLAAASKFDLTKSYPLPEAIHIAKETSYAKFNATLEAHFNLGLDVSRDDQKIRTTVVPPHGTGKEKRVLVFVSHEFIREAKEAGADIIGDEAKIEEIARGTIDFEVVVADPSFMPKLSKVAKVLGPKGLMPNPKSGTVTPDPVRAVRELKKGRLELRTESNAPVLHAIIGKVSFGDRALFDNFFAVYSAVKAAKPSKTKGTYIESVTLSATMGPGVKVDLTSLMQL